MNDVAEDVFWQFTITNEFISKIWPVGFLCFGAGLILGIVIMRLANKQNNFINKIGRGISKAFRWLFKAVREKLMDDIIFAISIIVFIGSTALGCLGIANAFCVTSLNVFATLIFSWILTKKSSDSTLKATLAETAKKSRRYIDSTRAIIVDAKVEIENTLKAISNIEDDREKSQKLLDSLLTVQANVKDMEHGIQSCIKDWEDMMDEKEVKTFHDEGVNTREIQDAEKRGVVPTRPSTETSDAIDDSVIENV